MSRKEEIKQLRKLVIALAHELGYTVVKTVEIKSEPSCECPGAMDYWPETTYQLEKL